MVGSLEYTNGDFISKNMENKRKYLLYDDVLRDSSLRPVFDTCIAGIVNKEILHVSKTRADAGYPSYPCFRVNGKEILVGAAFWNLNSLVLTLSTSEVPGRTGCLSKGCRRKACINCLPMLYNGLLCIRG